MKITRHGEYLWQLTRLSMVNCYLVRQEDGLVLIDTGLAGSARGIMKASRTLDYPITCVTLTHAHLDHAGSLDEIVEQLPGVRIALPERTAAFLQGNRSLQPGEPQDKLRGSFVVCKSRPTELLKPGELLGTLRVVAAPGHTPDQVAFYNEQDGTLIAGDAFQTLGGFAVAGVVRWRFPLPALGTWHLPTSLATARKLKDTNPSRLAIGHGKVLEDPTALMEQGIREAEKKVSR